MPHNSFLAGKTATNVPARRRKGKMTVSPDVQQCIETDGCRGRRSRADRDSGGPRRVPQQRVQVFEDGGPLPAAACGGKEEEACNRQVRRFYRRHTRGRPLRPQEAAPQRAEDLRQARRRAGLRGILSDGVPLCEGMEARAGAVPTRRLPRARLGAGHHAGRLWHLHRHRRRREARAEAPQSRRSRIRTSASASR